MTTTMLIMMMVTWKTNDADDDEVDVVMTAVTSTTMAITKMMTSDAGLSSGQLSPIPLDSCPLVPVPVYAPAKTAREAEWSLPYGINCSEPKPRPCFMDLRPWCLVGEESPVEGHCQLQEALCDK